MKTGQWKQLASDMEKSAAILTTEAGVQRSLAMRRASALRWPSALDVQEVYAGWAEISLTAADADMRVGQPVEKDLGTEITADGSGCLVERVLSSSPWLTVWELPCTIWCRFQDINYARRLIELWRRRVREKPKVQQCAYTCDTLHHRGKFFLIENPSD